MPRASSTAPSWPPRSSSSDAATISQPNSRDRVDRVQHRRRPWSTCPRRRARGRPARAGRRCGRRRRGPSAPCAPRSCASPVTSATASATGTAPTREPADRVELDRRLERFDDRLADDLDAVTAERHLATVEVPARGAARRQRELALLDRVLPQRGGERGLGRPHEATSAARLRRRRQQRPQAARRRRRNRARVARPLGVGHEADNVAGRVPDARDVVEAAVRVLDVADDDPVLGPQLGERLGRADVVALEVVDRDPQDVTGAGLAGQHRRGASRPAGRRSRRGTSGRRSSAARREAARPRRAPGSRCRSRRPGRRRPRSSATDSMTGENRAIAPVRR